MTNKINQKRLLVTSLATILMISAIVMPINNVYAQLSDEPVTVDPVTITATR